MWHSNLSLLNYSLCSIFQKHKKQSSLSGNWTPVSRVTGGDTYHYTNKDSCECAWKIRNLVCQCLQLSSVAFRQKVSWYLMCMFRFTEGSTLTFRSVAKKDAGAFLCIAANGIPPKRSKRFALTVLCKYIFYYLQIGLSRFHIVWCIFQ